MILAAMGCSRSTIRGAAAHHLAGDVKTCRFPTAFDVLDLSRGKCVNAELLRLDRQKTGRHDFGNSHDLRRVSYRSDQKRSLRDLINAKYVPKSAPTNATGNGMAEWHCSHVSMYLQDSGLIRVEKSQSGDGPAIGFEQCLVWRFPPVF